MEVANALSNNIDDESEVDLLEMSQFFVNPLSNEESGMFTSYNGIHLPQEYSSGMFSKKLIFIIHLNMIICRCCQQRLYSTKLGDRYLP